VFERGEEQAGHYQVGAQGGDESLAAGVEHTAGGAGAIGRGLSSSSALAAGMATAPPGPTRISSAVPQRQADSPGTWQD
jgi:hypothetical protein